MVKAKTTTKKTAVKKTPVKKKTTGRYFEAVGNDGDYAIDKIFIMGSRKTISLENMKEWFKDLVRYSIQRDTGHYIWSNWSINTMQER